MATVAAVTAGARQAAAVRLEGVEKVYRALRGAAAAAAGA